MKSNPSKLVAWLITATGVALIFFSLCLWPTPGRASALISPVAASGTGNASGFYADQTINDSLVYDAATGTTPTDAAYTTVPAYVGNTATGFWESPTAGNPYAKYDLWGTTKLTDLYIWNGNRSGLPGRGIKTADVYVSNTGIGSPQSSPSEWTKITASPISVAQNPGTGNAAVQQIALSSSIAARYVAVVPLTTWSNDGYVDVSEIRFQGSGGTIVPIANPSFQPTKTLGISGDLNGWTVSGSAGTQAFGGDTYNASNSHLGNYAYLRTSGAGQSISLSQNLGTVQGSYSYQLQLMLSQRQTTVDVPYFRVELQAYNGFTYTDILDSGQQITTGTLLGGWQTLALDGKALASLNGQQLILKISAINRTTGVNDLAIDDVRLLAIIPEPSTLFLIGVGSGLVVWGRKRGSRGVLE